MIMSFVFIFYDFNFRFLHCIECLPKMFSSLKSTSILDSSSMSKYIFSD